ncbi:ABC transporter substrate-binding protein [Novacetimonas hansenii]|uniref:ABC transporter substrate-binding protein n=1 Tax=Novacetimonas hansenii TaxID=436 RepID=UPI00248DBC02|nr:ABC transporter substrate-binding protein [Novacetimonas hansenii]
MARSMFSRFGTYVFAAVMALCTQAYAAPTVRVGYIPVLGSAPLFVMDGRHWLKDAGIDMQLIRFQSGPQAIQALAAGKIDAYVAGVLPLLQARAHGVNVKVVASAAIEELEVMANGPLAQGLPETASQPMEGAALKQRFDDFARTNGRKAKIGAQPLGSVPDSMLRYWLKARNDLDPAQVAEIVGVDLDAEQQAFLAGAVDAAVLREPTLTLVRHRLPQARILATGHDMMPGQPGSVLAILNEDAPDRAEWKEKFLAAFVRATDLLSHSPDEAVPYVRSALAGGMLPQAIVQESLRASASHYVSDPSIIVDSVSKLQDFEVQNGLLHTAQPVADLFDLESYRRLGK